MRTASFDLLFVNNLKKINESHLLFLYYIKNYLKNAFFGVFPTYEDTKKIHAPRKT